MNDEQVAAVLSEIMVVDPARMLDRRNPQWSEAELEQFRRQNSMVPRSVWEELNRRKPEPPKSMAPNATLAEIHDAFDHAAEDAVEEAKRILDDARLKRAERLKFLGFTSSADVREAGPMISKIEIGKAIAPLVVQYEKKYHKKFITKEQAASLAVKYGLIFGPAKQFRGQIPEENLVEIESFMAKAPIKPVHTEMMMVAPYADFDTRGYTIRNGEMVYDPIVLYPVKGGFLIVTAWGEEAKDPLVQRESTPLDIAF